MREHHAKHVRLPPLAFGRLDPRSRAKVYLGLLAWLTLHAPHRQRTNDTETPKQAPYTVVTDLGNS